MNIELGNISDSLENSDLEYGTFSVKYKLMYWVTAVFKELEKIDLVKSPQRSSMKICPEIIWSVLVDSYMM